MTILEGFVSEFSRLRQLGFGRLEAVALIIEDPARITLRVFLRVCIVLPLFMVGMITVSLCVALPTNKVIEVASIILGNAGLTGQAVLTIFLLSALLEAIRGLLTLSSELNNPQHPFNVLSSVRKTDGSPRETLKDKQQ
ncbi:MAG: hypothetical protein P4L95_02310 [Rouxiella aceris]|uniref:hypothetical protein n=1 Tax=Rouxiella aceris TaxID=2703884 RepID=UPI002840C223|nr:hypothetical protein [Rouxiella aceris]MDR3430734.1 hypothetical protein [Rouxiella aceris]